MCYHRNHIFHSNHMQTTLWSRWWWILYNFDRFHLCYGWHEEKRQSTSHNHTLLPIGKNPSSQNALPPIGRNALWEVLQIFSCMDWSRSNSLYEQGSRRWWRLHEFDRFHLSYGWYEVMCYHSNHMQTTTSIPSSLYCCMQCDFIDSLNLILKSWQTTWWCNWHKTCSKVSK